MGKRDEKEDEGMSKNLPYHLKVLFEPGPPLKAFPPSKEVSHDRYDGVASYLKYFQAPGKVEGEGTMEKLIRKQEERRSYMEELVERRKAWYHREGVGEEKKRTIIVARIPYEMTETQLERLCGSYGPIETVRLIMDRKGKSRGYGFVRYEKEKDARVAVRYLHQREVEGRRIVADIVRAGIDPGFAPQYLGGGLGNTRQVRPRARPPPPPIREEGVMRERRPPVEYIPPPPPPPMEENRRIVPRGLKYDSDSDE